jgi:AbrB family looped-hinge helix DNA binding protein
MITTTNMDKAGRIVLPKPVRDELGLGPGDSLELESSEDQIVLRPARGGGRMYKEHGMWVFDAGVPLTVETVNKTLRQVREERDRRNLGRHK